MSKEVETKIKKEISKHPGFANEESILSERMNELQSKFELFEDEILRRTKDLISNFKNLKKDQLQLQKRVGDSIGSKEFEIVIDMARADLEEKIMGNKDEIGTLK